MTVLASGWPGALGHPFFLHAVLAGAAVAAASGMVGYFLVLRAQVFTGDALSHMAFTGSLAALAAGVDLRLGLYAATIAVAVLLGTLSRSGRADDVAIGSVFAWITGLGAFFLTLYTTSGGANNAGAGVRVLFGSIFGMSAGQAGTAAAVAAGVCAVVLAVFRPLLFASVDEAVAAARGVPVRLLGFGFLALVGVTAAEASQAVGSLLLLGLLAAPAGTAQRLTDNPARAFALSTVLAVAEMWGGLTISYAVPKMPPSFAIVAVAATVYAAAFAVGARPRSPAPRLARA
ncbi:metal ABC transporter permease [Streptomyces sp. NPDC088194]|uniref:metal ABC transporter permease n=1 Tax=Streptomyces sp. NPDC088194 TaxID=3154931 RepID=UPI00344D7CE2